MPSPLALSGKQSHICNSISICNSITTNIEYNTALSRSWDQKKVLKIIINTWQEYMYPHSMMSLVHLIFSLLLLTTAPVFIEGRNIPFSSQEISTRQHMPAESRRINDDLYFGFHHVGYPSSLNAKYRNHFRSWSCVIDKACHRITWLWTYVHYGN